MRSVFTFPNLVFNYLFCWISKTIQCIAWYQSIQEWHRKILLLIRIYFILYYYYIIIIIFLLHHPFYVHSLYHQPTIIQVDHTVTYFFIISSKMILFCLVMHSSFIVFGLLHFWMLRVSFWKTGVGMTVSVCYKVSLGCNYGLDEIIKYI